MFFKQSKWEDAIKWYDKSLAEHRNPEVNKKKQTVRGVAAGGVAAVCILL